MINFLQLLDAAVFSPDVYCYDKGKIVLSALYLVLRIEVESEISSDPHCYRSYYEKFRKGPNPIYTDKFGFNELFSEFLQVYELEIGDLNPTNKFVAQFLDLDFAKSTDPQQVLQRLCSFPHTTTCTRRPTTARCCSTPTPNCDIFKLLSDFTN